jgi:ubiquinone/menaquinone biosynthesis C-methylase UbiE/nicotinamide mononucleotide adenylyltransferase
VIALLLGRFHALTRGQAELVASFSQEVSLQRIVCVVTSADHSGTRRNPLDAETREALLRPALAATGKPFALVRVNDIPDDAAWVEHVRAAVRAQTGIELAPTSTTLVSANREVQALFAAAGFTLATAPAGGLTPSELIARVVDGKEWKSEAAASTIDVFTRREVPALLARIFADKLRTDDGELASHRDFASYGAQMDASLVQKVEDLLPWVKPPRIADKGCGTGKLLVELSRRFPGASLVGVDLSRELLRRSDENTYAGGDVELVAGDAADQQLPDSSADTVIFSSIMHEIYSYSGYDKARIDRALASAARELKKGGRLLIRDGISPDAREVLLDLMDAPTAAQLERFAREFKHGNGARYEKVAPRAGALATVRLSAHDANEFLCKKDYLKHWDIEIHEEYGALTVGEWRAALARNFFGVLTITSYVNAWILQNRYRDHVKVTELDGTSFWPATNAVIIGERT